MSKAKPRLDDDDLEEYVTRVMPQLAASVPGEALELAINLLRDVVRNAGEDRARFDTIWRPAIEHDHMFGDELLNLGTSLVRDTALQILTASPERTPDLVDQLVKTDLKIARRVASFVLSRFPSYAVDHVRKLLLDEDRLRRSFDYREYALVLRSGFGVLSDSERQQVLDVLDRGPDLDSYARSFEQWQKRAATDCDIRSYVEYWRLRFLTQIDSDAVPTSYREEFRSLVAKHGQVEEKDDVTVWEGSPSPKTADDLLSMTNEQIVAFLREWTPSHGDESIEGLGDALREASRKEPARFSSDAALFCVGEPIYVSDLIGGIDEAVRGGGTCQQL